MREVRMVLSIMLPDDNDEPESVIRARVRRTVLPLIGNPCRIEELPEPKPDISRGNETDMGWRPGDG
jgi:hypothetical protein